jgi:chromosome partitioning protein
MPKAAPTRPRIIAIANNKGGVGKTTTTINLAGALVLREKRVLVIDLDPQANASIALDVVISPDSLGTKLLLQDETHAVQDCTYDKGPYLDIVPAQRTLVDIQHPLLINPAGRTRLRDKLKTGGKSYDYVLLDCPPDVGSLTQSALVAASDVLIPVDVGYFSIDGLDNMLDLLAQVQKAFNPDLRLLGILVTKYDARTTLSSNTVASIQEEHLPLLAPPIRVCVEVIRAQMERAPVSIVSPDSSAAADYEALAETLLPARERTSRTKTPGRKVVQLRRQQPK